MKYKFRTPRGIGGWVEVYLNSTEMDYLWKRIKAAEEKDEDVRGELVGQLSTSLNLEDIDNYFNGNVLQPLVEYYFRKEPIYQRKLQGNRHSSETRESNYVVELDGWWVNKQKQYEYNPIHNHSGTFSFAIWMSEPVESEEQNKRENSIKSNNPQNHQFAFHYLDMLGGNQSVGYPLGKGQEGRMLFFPSQLHHSVNPFFDSDGIRVSIAGNMSVITRPHKELVESLKKDN